MTTAEPAGRPLALVIVLALVTLLAIAFVFMGLAGQQFTTDTNGVTREVGSAERIATDPARFLLPLALAAAAGAACVGLRRRSRWAPGVALTVGVSVLVIGAWLLYQAAREWGMEGSFSPLLVPPGAACLGVGLYILLAARAVGGVESLGRSR